MLDDMAPQDIDLRKNIRYNTTLYTQVYSQNLML